MGGVGLIDKKMKKNQGKIGDFAALAGLKRASDSVIREFKSLYPSQEGIIRTMKEIHGSYYFLRKNISALSSAESRDFKEILC